MDTSDKWTLSWRNGTELHSRQITKYMKEKQFCYWKFVFLQKSKICQRSLVFLPIEPQSKFRIVVTDTAQKWSFPLRISSVNVPNPQEPADFVTFTEEILNGKLHCLCSVRKGFKSWTWWWNPNSWCGENYWCKAFVNMVELFTFVSSVEKIKNELFLTNE